jgi:gamma-glutamylcyclotransferase (GGCT)/AIG2-like uncharacterized protein YtfP
MDSQAQVTRLFVYGTLQRGEVRAKFWPRAPICVEPAYALARLHDLGPYPAMVEGEDRVRGELWTLAADDMPVTLEALDAVEGFNQGGKDWYVRRQITCTTFDGRRHEAYTYYWGHGHDISHTPIVPPDADGYCDWKRMKTRRVSEGD